MSTYCKRDKYIIKYFFGKNNKGHISIRGRQGLSAKLTQARNINYNYIFKKIIGTFVKSDNKLIMLKIINKTVDNKLGKFIYRAVCLNSILNRNYKYLPVTKNLQEGDIISIGYKAAAKIGNILPVGQLPCGSLIHNIEHVPTRGAVFVKCSKTSAFLIYIGRKYVTIKLPSGEVRLLNNNVFCILGELLTSPLFEKKNRAGDSRLLGRRPKVRGVAMNACDHPHGGGEGRNSIGRPSTYSPWGAAAKGCKTRRMNKYSTKLILMRRKKND